MAGTKLRYIVDDIAVDLRQVLDDKIVQDAQIAHWVILVGNRLRAQHIGKRDSGAFLHIFDNIKVNTVAQSSLPNEIKNRKFITLPECIYDYDKDGGVEYISYSLEEDMPGCPPPFTNTTFDRTTPSKTERLYYSKYESPNPSRPYFYRAGNYIYFLGIECVDIKSVEIGIYSTLNPVDKVDLDEPFDFPEELLIVLKRQVLDLGRWALMIPQEKINDGNDDTKPGSVPTNKLVSVNELSEDQIDNK